MTDSNKRIRLRRLARVRQRTYLNGYRRIADYHGGGYECDHVSPYTKTAGNFDAEIMVVLQDWASDEGLSGPVSSDSATLGHTPHLPTNRNLTRLLSETFGLSLKEVYGTNVFPFVKLGGMSATIPQGDLVATAKRFTLLEIQIVNPKLVVCLGSHSMLSERRPE